MGVWTFHLHIQVYLKYRTEDEASYYRTSWYLAREWNEYFEFYHPYIDDQEEWYHRVYRVEWSDPYVIEDNGEYLQ